MLVVAPIVGGNHRRHGRAPDHPRPVRPHDRHAAGHLGPEPVLRRPRRRRSSATRWPASARRSAASRSGATASACTGWSLSDRGGHRGRRSTSCCVRPARPDGPRHDGERRHGRRARRQSPARVHRDLRRRAPPSPGWPAACWRRSRACCPRWAPPTWPRRSSPSSAAARRSWRGPRRRPRCSGRSTSC